MSIIFWLAAIPPLFLLYQVYRMDTVEKEPVRLIVTLLLAGALTTVVAGVLESIFSVLYTWTPNAMISDLIQYFIVVAVSEEGVKYLALRKLTWNHPAFDYTFDGVVYAVAVSLGFALAENILYVGMYGLSTAVIRAFTAIVLHGICGIFLGIYYGSAKKMAVAGNQKAYGMLMRRGFLFAVLTHGAYDFCATRDSGAWTVVFFAFLIFLYIVAYRVVKKYQQMDTRVDGFDGTGFRR